MSEIRRAQLTHRSLRCLFSRCVAIVLLSLFCIPKGAAASSFISMVRSSGIVGLPHNASLPSIEGWVGRGVGSGAGLLSLTERAATPTACDRQSAGRNFATTTLTRDAPNSDVDSSAVSALTTAGFARFATHGYDTASARTTPHQFVATKTGTPCHSFRYDTSVLMADGPRKRISEVEIGDRVLTTDPDTGELVVREVTELHVNRDSDMANVTVRDENGDLSTIHTTGTHQFWSQTDSRWAEAAALDAGELLRAFDGSKVTVVGVRTWDGLETMYDLTIEGVHAYYVTAGDEQVLVHNCGDPLPTQISGRTQRLTSKQAADLAEYNGYRPTLSSKATRTANDEFLAVRKDH